MASPSARPSRRRQRSTRLLVAVLLIALSGVLVLGAALTGSFALTVIAGLAATLLGAGAVRITHAELAESRREAARDRADQARAYRGIAQERSAEQAIYVADTSGRIARHEATISRLESRLVEANVELTRARQDLADEQASGQRVSAERDRLARGRDDAEERAAVAIVRVVELEQELDVVLSEWRAGQSAPRRKRA